MSDSNANKNTGNVGPSSPGIVQTVGQIGQQTVERKEVPIPGYILMDNCLLLKDACFQIGFREFFTPGKIKIYLTDMYNTEVVENLVMSLRISPLPDVPELDCGDREIVISKLVHYGSLGLEKFHRVNVLYRWLIDQLKYFSIKQEFKPELVKDTYEWCLHWSKIGVQFGLVGSMDSSALKSFIAHAADYGDTSGLFEYTFDSTVKYSDYASFYGKIHKDIFKRYVSPMLITKHVSHVKAAQREGFRTIHFFSGQSEYTRISKLNELSFSGKI